MLGIACNFKSMLLLSPWPHSWLSSDITLPLACALSQEVCICTDLSRFISKFPTTTLAVLFSPVHLRPEDGIHQFYYFKSFQITQWLGEEYSALMLSTICFQPPLCLPVVEGAGSRLWLLCLTHSKAWSKETSFLPVSLLFLLESKVFPFLLPSN